MGLFPAPALADALGEGEEAVVIDGVVAEGDEDSSAADVEAGEIELGEELVEEDAPVKETPEEGIESATPTVSEDVVAQEDELDEVITQTEADSDDLEPEPATEPKGDDDESHEGSCGVNATWSYNAETKTLTISGEGEMSDYETVLDGEERPWDNLEINTVIVDDGITYIGNYAFYGMQNITIEIPASVSRIGEGTIDNETVTIRAYDNTYAELYARSYAVAFESLGSLEIDLAKCKITLEQSEYEYTGSAIKPAITVSYGENTLEAGADYSYRFENNILPGQASVILTAKTGSLFVGSATVQFTILPLANEISFEEESFSIKASATDAQTVDARATATGGTITYSTDKSTVLVDEAGVVTIPAMFAGEVVVTAKAIDPDGIYADASKTVTITVSSIANKITTSANSYSKTASTSAQTFSLGTKRNDSGKVTYKSSTKSVAIASNGKVTIAKNYVGKATITISVAKNGIYNAATKKVTVTVKPAKVVVSKLSNSAANKATVQWKKAAGAGGYQIQYSLKKDFSTAGKANITSASTLTKTLTSLVKGKTYYVRVRAYKKTSSTTYYGAWSSTKAVSIKKGNTITLKGTPKITSADPVYGELARTVKYSGVTGATGYQVYYRVEKGSSVSAWKSAGTTTAKSMKIKVKHGKTTYYSFKVRAYKKRADGSTIYSKFSSPTHGLSLYARPDVITVMSDETKSSTTYVLAGVANNGNYTLRIYSKNAMLIDNDYSSYDRNLKLVDTDALKKGVTRYISYVDIPAGTSKVLAFVVASDKATWYDEKSTLSFRALYDGAKYTYRLSNYYGTRYTEID